MTLLQMTVSFVDELLAQAGGQALLLGLAFVATAVVVGLVRRAWGFLVLGVGTFGSVALAIREFQATGSLVLPVVILAVGIGASGFLAWLVYPTGLVGTAAFLAAGWYLLLLGFLGSFAGMSLPWDLVWATLVVAGTYGVHRATQMLQVRRATVQHREEPVAE